MSGDQYRASHVRAEPFLKASDFVDREETPEPAWTLDALAKAMLVGFNETNRRIDELVPVVESMRQSAQWKVWLVKAAKLAGPALVGAIAARFPEAAKIASALLSAMAGAP